MPDDVNGKLDTLIKSVRETAERVENIETLLVGDVKDSGKVGVLERIRQIEKWIAKMEWYGKILLVAVVGNVIGLVFLLLQNALTK